MNVMLPQLDAERQKYAEETLKPVLDAFLLECVREMPEDPAEFCLQWLQGDVGNAASSATGSNSQDGPAGTPPLPASKGGAPVTACAPVAPGKGKDGKGKGKAEGKVSGKGKGKEGPKPDWKSKLAEAEAAKKVWSELDLKTLPTGPLDDPRWETCWATQMPDSGTSALTIFVATLQGTYCLKGLPSGAAANRGGMAEYFACLFNARLGLPTPRVRVVYQADAEFAQIRNSIQRAGEAAEKKGLLNKPCSWLRMVSDDKWGMAIMVSELVSNSTMFGGLPESAARNLLEPPGASWPVDPGTYATWSAATQRVADFAWATQAPKETSMERQHSLPPPASSVEATRARLQALGRVHIADVFLWNRDRFINPLFAPQGRPGVAAVGPQLVSPWGTLQAYQELLTTCEEKWATYLIGNPDNLLVRDAADADAAAFSFIDNVANRANADPDYATTREYLRSFVAEAAEDSDGLAHLEFMRFTVRVTCHHVLSDAALREVRLGSLHALRELAQPEGLDGAPGFFAWMEALLADMEAREAQHKLDRWAGDARQWLLEATDAVRAVVAERDAFFAALPLPAQLGAAEPVEQAVDEALRADSLALGARPALWLALRPELRQALACELRGAES